MALTLYLAMTAAEMRNCDVLPEHIAWMACHFSPYSSGISNIPTQLPEHSMLILNDRIPPQGHDPALVAAQLAQAVTERNASRVLLDLQRPGCEETAAITQAVISAVPCPVGVTPAYAEGLACPVFLSPQLRKPLAEQLQVWQERQIWLEAPLECEQAVITETGSSFSPALLPDVIPVYHDDPALHCRYFLELKDDHACFTIWREMTHLQALLDEAEALGVSCAIGLYQQLHKRAAED